MRVSPAFQVTVRQQGAWRVAVALCIAASLAAVGAWWWLLEERTPGAAALAASSLLAVAFGASALRLPARRLRWDSQRWWVGPADGAADERPLESLEVVLDLSSWMLLRLRPTGARRLAACLWLPVQRHGLEREWHALRCAVHASRAAADTRGPKASSW